MRQKCSSTYFAVEGHTKDMNHYWVNEHTILCSKMSFLVYINVGLTPWKQHFAVPLFMI